MAKTEESKLEQEVEKFMREKRIWQLARFQAQYNQNGLPDRLYLYKGLLLGLELKTDKGSPTILQLRKLKEINNNGGIALIIRNIREVEQLLKLVDKYVNLDASIQQYYILKEMKEWMEEHEY